MRKLPLKNRVNPFTAIYQVCNQGNSTAKLQALPSFPKYLDLELTNKCNFRCLMCPTGVGTITRHQGLMSPEVFHSILEQIAPYRTPVRLIRWGEPLLHPDLINCIKELKRAGSIVHMNTNGSLLDEAMMDLLLETELDSIKFSFQGVDKKSYGEMRNIDFFEGLLKKVILLHQKRGNRRTPFLHVSTTITYETAEQVATFKEAIRNHVDLVTVGRTILEHIDPDKTNLGEDKKALLRDLASQESVIKKHPECPEVFDKLSINWDGTVSACSGDYDNKMLIGDLRCNSLQEIWMSEKMASYRAMLVALRHHEIPLCSHCYDYHGLQTAGLQLTD
jgi:radical SAM protein with 4Fe4S-binding SPASM domain